ncbi:hypothetical protein KKE34_04930 [Patescibacteria group bacterium]|nr:hypothetical protein [Patescibacteria group bacterium]MBU1885918.1 hypothetical protein [Patescibacteria group bacterium]
MEKNNQHFFTTGFTLGLFSGVVGYYLFGTKQGEKTRKKLANEWEQAHQYLVDQGVLDKKYECKNLGDFMQLAKDELLKKLDIKPGEQKKDSALRKKRIYIRHTKQKQFKGV